MDQFSYMLFLIFDQDYVLTEYFQVCCVAHNVAREKRSGRTSRRLGRTLKFFLMMGDVRGADVISTIEGATRATMSNVYERRTSSAERMLLIVS
jgi:hypothetical protein